MQQMQEKGILGKQLLLQLRRKDGRGMGMREPSTREQTMSFVAVMTMLVFKPENDIGIKTFVDNYKYCRSCGIRMLGVVEFRAK